MRHQIYHVKLHTPKPILVARLWVVVAVCVTLHLAFKYAYQRVIGGVHLSLSSLFAILVELRTAGGAMNQTCQRLGRTLDRVMGCQLEQLRLVRTGTLKYMSRLVTKLQEVRCYFRVIDVSDCAVLPGKATRRSWFPLWCMWGLPCLVQGMSCATLTKKWSWKKKSLERGKSGAGKKNPECEMHNIILFRIIILLVMVLLRGRPLPLDGVRKKPS